MDVSLLLEPFERKNEKPLDYLVSDGGYARIFRRIACVGDSLSSGEFETVDEDGTIHYNDIYEHSWGQYLARMTGAKVYNFSRAGMSANVYCESFADNNGFWDPALASQAYIIALGVNDILNQCQELGSIDDICLEDWHRNKKTFAGYVGQIVQRYKILNPDAKFFFMTIPRSKDGEEREIQKGDHAALLYNMASFFSNSYVLDFNQYAPLYSGRFYDLFFLRSHMNPCGYLVTAKMVASYLDYIVRHNPDDFKMIGMV